MAKTPDGAERSPIDRQRDRVQPKERNIIADKIEQALYAPGLDAVDEIAVASIVGLVKGSLDTDVAKEVKEFLGILMTTRTLKMKAQLETVPPLPAHPEPEQRTRALPKPFKTHPLPEGLGLPTAPKVMVEVKVDE